MRTLPEEDAVEVFRRVRNGSNAGAIVSHIKDGNLLLQLQLVPESRFRYDLPYSRDIAASLLSSGSLHLDSLLSEAASQRAMHIQSHATAATDLTSRRLLTESIPSEYQNQ